MNTITPAWPLYTERLMLRPFEEGDLQALYEMQSDRESVRYLYYDVRSLEEVRVSLARKMASTAVVREGDGVTAAAVLLAIRVLPASIFGPGINPPPSFGRLLPRATSEGSDSAR